MRLAFLIPPAEPILYECSCRLTLFRICCHEKQFLFYPLYLTKISRSENHYAKKKMKSSAFTGGTLQFLGHF